MKIGNLVKSKFLAVHNNLRLGLLLLSTLSIIFFWSCAQENKSISYSISGSTMGTSYSVKFIDSDEKVILAKIQTKVDSVLNVVNQQMSTYIKNSEISLFNSLKDTSWFKVSKDVALVMHEARKLYEDTDGIYDITVGPIVNLWGFGPDLSTNSIPSNKEIRKVKQKVGASKLFVDTDKSRIRKSIPDLYCDLSSIAKGFGVDKIGLLLEKYKITNYMVEIGGEVRTKGLNENKENWRIGISTPLSNGLQKIISLTDISVATSGDYLNYFEKNGIRYSHLIDIRTGRPIKHSLASVSVLHANCSTADAIATAINVMGPDLGYKFALEKKLPIFMIVREGQEFIEKMTPQFEKYIYEGN